MVTLAGAIVALVVAGASIRQRPDPLAPPITVLLTGVAFWGVAQAIGFAVTTPETVVRLQQAQYLGIVLVPLFFYIVSFRYVGYERWLNPRILGGFAVIPAITLAIVATHPWHELLWADVTIETVAGATVMVPVYGPWFWIHLAWAYILVFAALSVLALKIVRGGPLHRKQAMLVFLAALIPFVLNVVHFAGVGPVTLLDLTPVAFSVAGAIFALAFFSFDLIELRPVAREHMIEELRDGVIVVGPSGQIRDYNPVGSQIIADQPTGKDGSTTIPLDLVNVEGTVSAQVDGEAREFRVEHEIFEDRTGGNVGQLVYLRDVTGIVRREQRISVLHRVLRHNIRNELTVLRGNLEFVRAETGEAVNEFLEAIDESADRIFSLAEKARLVEQTLRTKAGDEDIELDETVEAAIATVSRNFPAAHVQYAGTHADDQCTMATVPDQQLVERALVELVENGLIHGNGTDAAVGVRLDPNERGVAVEVIDDGPGIPDTEIEAIEASVETALEHGSGVGLWLARWTADLCGGELAFEKQDAGNVVRLNLPCEACQDAAEKASALQ